MYNFSQSWIKWFSAGFLLCLAFGLFINNQYVFGFILLLVSMVLIVTSMNITGSNQSDVPEEWKMKGSKKFKPEHTSIYKAFYGCFTRRTIQPFDDTPIREVIKYCASIPCENLVIIDTLWGYYSNGKFGFNSQLKVMLENGIEIKDSGDVEILAPLLGWKETENDQRWWIHYEDLTFNLNKAPVGHLPVELFLTLDKDANPAGIQPKEEPSGKKSQLISFAPLIWMELQSQFAQCYENKSN